MNPVFKASAVVLWATVSLFGQGSTDLKVVEWISKIEKLSERGDLSAVRHERQDLAEYAFSAGHFDVAARQFELLLAARPRKAERVKLSTRLGHARMAQQDYSRAIAAYDDALHDSAKDWEASISQARAFSAADLNKRAIESYEHCIRLRPEEAAPYEEIAQVYERQGFLTKAISYYDKALTRDPKPAVYLRLADCYAHQKNMAKAIEILSFAKSRLPRAEYDVRLGEIYLRLGDTPRAMQAWEDALKADTRRDDVRLSLMMLYDHAGRRPESERLYRDVSNAFPESPLVHYLRAMMLLERGERESARVEALRVQQLSPTELVAHFNELLLLEIRNPS